MVTSIKDDMQYVSFEVEGKESTVSAMNLFPRLSLGAAQNTVWVFGAGASAGPPYNVPVQQRLLDRRILEEEAARAA